MRPTLMSPTPSPSSNINITKAHIPFSQPIESLVNPNSPNHSAYRPLNVTHALAYLDLVKNRFSDKPNVYHRFLDIMKDFKSQA
ncbi:hypothetical protein BD560DRAFT_384932 [Blakeslea trispora]|nr:hypothetical protein BD560DRAFT_384932 [Blakeslea trispora]